MNDNEHLQNLEKSMRELTDIVHEGFALMRQRFDKQDQEANKRFETVMESLGTMSERLRNLEIKRINNAKVKHGREQSEIRPQD